MMGRVEQCDDCGRRWDSWVNDHCPACSAEAALAEAER